MYHIVYSSVGISAQGKVDFEKPLKFRTDKSTQREGVRDIGYRYTYPTELKRKRGSEMYMGKNQGPERKSSFKGKNETCR